MFNTLQDQVFPARPTVSIILAEAYDEVSSTVLADLILWVVERLDARKDVKQIMLVQPECSLRQCSFQAV